LKVIAPPERQHSVWNGGSILTKSMKNEDYISKEGKKANLYLYSIGAFALLILLSSNF